MLGSRVLAQHSVFKTTISYVNDKVDGILTSIQCMPYLFSKS